MEYFKLQFGCLLYIAFVYCREYRHYHIRWSFTLYNVLLCSGVASLLLDGATAYCVNHLDTVNPVLNAVLHGLFLISIDTVIFVMFLYLLDAAECLPRRRSRQLLLCAPFVVNVAVVVFNLGALEYRIGRVSNYSMGVPVYTCYAMAAIYVLAIVVLCFGRLNYIEKHKRANLFSCLLVICGVTGYQMLAPESLISGIGTTMLILCAYMNQEDPAMRELTRFHGEMVMGFSTLIENRDDSTGSHVKRTTLYVKLLAEELRRRGFYRSVLTKDYMNNLLKAAPMHDVGKVAVPDAILRKPGRLTAQEFEQMKQHAAKGGEIIRQTFGRLGNEQYMEMAYAIARHHHEKWNGNGYPDGLSGEDIPLCARIMAVADVFDAVSEDRCYRAALPLEQCFAIIKEGRGRDFDPLLVDVFLGAQDKVRAIREQKA